MAWQVALAAASTGLSIYGNVKQAQSAAESARARAISNAQTAKNLRTEAQGRRLINLERLVRANSAIVAGASARGIQIDSASNLAQISGNRARKELDNLAIDATTEQRIANLWADSDAAYRKAQLQAQTAGVSAFTSLLNGAATVAGAMKPSGNAAQTATSSAAGQGNYYGWMGGQGRLPSLYGDA